MNEQTTLSAQEFQERFDAIVARVGTVIKGKNDVIRLCLVGMLAQGHVLFEDMPGTGKTMLSRAMSAAIGADTSRVQCTPDLLPADVTGSAILDRQTGEFSFRPGPVFTNILLADELNRATPKTQSALLEAMAEARVTYDGVTRDLPHPFFVLATTNPLEFAGTFPLPEAQLDRFLFKLSLGYADREAEAELLRANEKHQAIDHITQAVTLPEFIDMIEFCKDVQLSDDIRLFIVDIVQETRHDPFLAVGASSRASQAMVRASKVLAAAQGRDDVLPDDVTALVKPILGHRLLLSPESQLLEETVSAVIDRVMARVRVPVALQ